MNPESYRAKEIALLNIWALEKLIEIHKERLAELEIKKPIHLQTIPEEVEAEAEAEAEAEVKLKEDFFKVKEVD